jgi:LysM repeat protein
MIRKSLLFVTIVVAQFVWYSSPAVAQTYELVVVARGDTLAKIASRHCTTWREIYDINRQAIGNNPNNLAPGTVLTVPNRCGSAPTPQPGGVYDRGPRQHATGSISGRYYTVAWGDTLHSIGTRFGVTVTALQQANNLPDGVLRAGQTLIIPGLGSTTPPPGPAPERVNFPPGANSAIRVGTIERGGSMAYVLRARAGQTMRVRTSSHGDPLLTTISTTNGRLLADSGTGSSGVTSIATQLPANGDYIVTVAPVRWPATQRIRFDIEFRIE